MKVALLIIGSLSFVDVQLSSTDWNQELVTLIKRTIRTEFDEAVKSFWSMAKTDAPEQQRKDAIRHSFGTLPARRPSLWSEDTV